MSAKRKTFDEKNIKTWSQIGARLSGQTSVATSICGPVFGPRFRACFEALFAKASHISWLMHSLHFFGMGVLRFLPEFFFRARWPRTIGSRLRTARGRCRGPIVHLTAHAAGNACERGRAGSCHQANGCVGIVAILCTFNTQLAPAPCRYSACAVSPASPLSGGMLSRPRTVASKLACLPAAIRFFSLSDEAAMRRWRLSTAKQLPRAERARMLRTYSAAKSSFVF